MYLEAAATQGIPDIFGLKTGVTEEGESADAPTGEGDNAVRDFLVGPEDVSDDDELMMQSYLRVISKKTVDSNV